VKTDPSNDDAVGNGPHSVLSRGVGKALFPC
jgi:hypothetical protein